MRDLTLRQLLMAAVIAVLCVATANAKLMQTDIEVEGNTYRYQFEAMIAAPIEATRAVITDPEALKNINDGVIESHVIETYADGALKRQLLVEQCVLVFCFDLNFIEKVEAIGQQEILATIIPEESNFSFGESLWRIEALDDSTTRVSVEARQTPDFWIPPVIGPIVFKRAFMKEVRETARNIEREALLDAVQ